MTDFLKKKIKCTREKIDFNSRICTTNVTRHFHLTPQPVY